MKKVFILLLLLKGQLGLLAQAGTLDPTFSTDGIIQIAHTQPTDFREVKVLPNGKILALGTVAQADDERFWAHVVQFNQDGSFDQGFGQNGTVYLPDSLPSIFSGHLCYTGQVLPDGKIVLITDVAYSNIIAVTRLLSDGTIDLTFGQNGEQNNLFTGIISPTPYSSFLMPDGKIIITGVFAYPEPTGIRRHGFVARLSSDGKLDLTFGIDGIVRLTPFPTASIILRAVKVQPDGKIVVVGDMASSLGNATWYIARLMPDGSMDTGFDSDGILTPNLGNLFWEEAEQLLILADGKILVAGHAQKLPGTHFTMLRLLPNGALDNTFGLGGKAQINFDCCYSGIHDLVQQDNGKIVAAGYSTGPDEFPRFALARFKPNGGVDQTFGDEGRVVIQLNHDSTSSRSTAVTLQPDGKILAAGYTIDTSTRYPIAALLVRLNTNDLVGTFSADQDFAATPPLEIFPNPVSGNSIQVAFSLSNGSNVSFGLFDLLGRKTGLLLKNASMLEAMHQEILQLPPDLPAGEYYLRLETENGSQTTKIIKAN